MRQIEPRTDLTLLRFSLSLSQPRRITPTVTNTKWISMKTFDTLTITLTFHMHSTQRLNFEHITCPFKDLSKACCHKESDRRLHNHVNCPFNLARQRMFFVLPLFFCFCFHYQCLELNVFLHTYLSINSPTLTESQQ